MRESGNFGYIVDQSSSTDITAIWSAEDEVSHLLGAIDPRERFAVNVVIESIRLDVYLPSFTKAPFPEIYPEMSAAEKNVELMKTEQKAPKTGLAFYRWANNSWHYLSEIVLQNRGRRTQIPVIIPYFTTNEIKILGRNSKIGYQVVDYGNGTIGNGDITSFQPFDKVQIEGDWRIEVEEINLRRNTSISQQKTVTIGKTGAQILDSNLYRASWEIQNQDASESVYFYFASNASSGQFILQPLAVAYSQPICETEELWCQAINDTSINLAVREISYG
ncbi:MAG: hypothetical protein AAFO04_24055 [Cyanobacteria bacterium J06592_8]